jgi:hypothetical protein
MKADRDVRGPEIPVLPFAVLTDASQAWYIYDLLLDLFCGLP